MCLYIQNIYIYIINYKLRMYDCQKYNNTHINVNNYI